MRKLQFKRGWVGMLALAAISVASPVLAFWADQPARCGTASDWLAKMEEGRRRNEMWPYPYNCPDRQRAHAPFDTMVQNGWRRQNLLGSHHFDDKQRLTGAGQMKIQWVLTQAPVNYRTLYVERSLDPSITESRLNAVRDFAANNNLTTDQTLAVVDTHIMSEGRPANTVDFVNEAFRENMVAPVLPAVSSGAAQE